MVSPLCVAVDRDVSPSVQRLELINAFVCDLGVGEVQNEVVRQTSPRNKDDFRSPKRAAMLPR